MEFPSDRTFVGSQGFDIYCRYWKPHFTDPATEVPAGLVMVSHGINEYCGTYETLIEALVQARFFVFGHDHAGHGSSGGQRSQIKTLDTYVRDVITHAEKIQKAFPDIPMFIVGHSMGGAIAILAALEEPTLFRGVVLIGPLITVSSDAATPTKRFLSRMLSSVIPGFGIADINNADLTLNKDVVERFNTDPLIYRGKITIGTAHALILAADKILQSFERIEFPFLCIQGGGDKLCECQGAQMLLDKAKSSDKTLNIFPGAYHRVQDEPHGVGGKCILSIVAWISQRC